MTRPVIATLLAALIPLSAASAQSATSVRIDKIPLGWIDSTRAQPWTTDTSARRVMLAQVFVPHVQAGPAALVLFSTGRNVSPSTYDDMAMALARAGYVVAVVDHTGERAGQRMPGGRDVPAMLDRAEPKRDSPTFRIDDSVFNRRWVDVRAADLINVREHLARMSAAATGPLAHRIDARTAAVGHSIGGITAAKACEREPALLACANLDGLSYSLPMHVDGAVSPLTQPFLFIGKPIRRFTDEELARDHMTRAQDDAITARFAQRFDALMSGPRGGYKVLISDGDHMDFAAKGSGFTAQTIRVFLMSFLDRAMFGLHPPVLDAPPVDKRVAVTRY